MTTNTPNKENADEADDYYSNSTRLGVYEGWPVFVGVSQRPADARAPETFGVNLYVPNGDGENIDIARIDTAHAGCHMDRLYLPEQRPNRQEDYTVQYETPDGALQFFLEDEKWKRWVQLFKDNHGLPDETRVHQPSQKQSQQ